MMVAKSPEVQNRWNEYGKIRFDPNSIRRLLCAGLATISVFAANGTLAQAAQNPIADLISLPFQNNADFNFGPDNETLNVLNIQPVWPFSLNDNWNLITRTIFPVVSIPGLDSGERRTSGLSDTVFTAFFSPVEWAHLSSY